MKPSKSNSSISTAKQPYSPATKLLEVPIALYEILDLATRGQAAAIVPLIESVIEVVQSAPDSLSKLQAAQAASDTETGGAQ